MNNGLDWLMAPVDAGMCRYESALDGTFDLADFADMNDYLIVKAENAYRARQAARGG